MGVLFGEQLCPFNLLALMTRMVSTHRSRPSAAASQSRFSSCFITEPQRCPHSPVATLADPMTRPLSYPGPRSSGKSSCSPRYGQEQWLVPTGCATHSSPWDQDAFLSLERMRKRQSCLLQESVEVSACEVEKQLASPVREST